MTSFKKALDFLTLSIQEDNKENIKIILDKFPWDTLEDDTCTNIFVSLLAQCTKYQRLSLIRYILFYWDEKIRYTYGFMEGEKLESGSGYRTAANYDDEDVLPSYAYVFSLAKIHPDTLRLIIMEFKEITEVQLLSLYTGTRDSAVIGYAMERIVQGYPSSIKKGKVYRVLYDDAIKSGNVTSQIFLARLVESTANAAPKPLYLRDFTENLLDRLPILEDYEDQLNDMMEQINISLENINVEDVSEEILNSLETIGFSVKEKENSENIKKQVQKIFQEASKDEKQRLLAPILKNNRQEEMRESEDLFHLFGPSFPVIGIDFSIKTPCTKWGGCRMFLCICAEKFDDDEDVIYNDDSIDWFRQNCDYCHLFIGEETKDARIPKRQWAVRKPRAEGGWIGCYCSWKCVINHLGYTIEQKKKYENEDEDEIVDENVDENVDEIINTCEKEKLNEETQVTYHMKIEEINKTKKETEIEETKESIYPIGKLLSDKSSSIDVQSLLLSEEFEKQINKIGIQDFNNKEKGEKKREMRNDVYRTVYEDIIYDDDDE